MEFPRTRAIIERAVIGARATPAAVIEVGRGDVALWTAAFGRLTYDADALACTTATIFDLASLTKVVATASIAMRAVDAGALEIDRPVGRYLPAWNEGARAAIAVRHLLDHSSGLPGNAKLWQRIRGRAAYAEALLELPLERAPGTAAVYSDPGFLLLGFVLEAVGGPLDRQFAPVAAQLTDALGYLPPAAWRDRIAPTEVDPWRGRLLQGEVHDENAAALGGVAPHAGLFATAGACGAFARLVLRTFREATSLGPPELMRTFAAKTGVPGSSRALAWDTMLPTSSCGTRMSPTAIGHTGFTGTSLWIDPARDVYVVLLTNRVHPTRENTALAAVRPQVHDAVADDLGM